MNMSFLKDVGWCLLAIAIINRVQAIRNVVYS
jgi:hypothetical protein